MHTLVLCRHAKSDWSHGLADFDRPLNERGNRDAPAMGALLARQEFQPDLIISSPAKRAFSTACKVGASLGIKPSQIRQESSVYEAQPGDLLRLIQGLPESQSTVMLFGHNPGMESMASLLMGMEAPFHLPTCGMVFLEVRSSWADISPSSVSLKAYLVPKAVL